eukprot:tig00020556_g11016.t1
MSPVVVQWPQMPPFQQPFQQPFQHAPQQGFLAGMREGAAREVPSRGKRRASALDLEDLDPRAKRALSEAIARELGSLSLQSPTSHAPPVFVEASSPIASTSTSMPGVKRNSGGFDRPAFGESSDAVARDLFGRNGLTQLQDSEMTPAAPAPPSSPVVVEPPDDNSRALVLYRPNANIFERLKESIPRALQAAGFDIDISRVDVDSSEFIRKIIMDQQARLREELQGGSSSRPRIEEIRDDEDAGMGEADTASAMQDDEEPPKPPPLLEWMPRSQPRAWLPADPQPAPVPLSPSAFPSQAAPPAAPFASFWPMDSGAGTGFRAP